MTFHEGELAVQKRAGALEGAARVGRIIHDTITGTAVRFAQARPFAVVGAMREEKMWAGLVVGDFHVTQDGDALEVTGSGDPLVDLVGPVGLLFIDPAQRQRLRINGTGQATEAGWRVTAREVYANCPQHITRREVDASVAALARRRIVSRGTSLPPHWQQWIGQADTWFVATRHPSRGADASHRGGQVVVDGPSAVHWDDYDGNTMFNTLGNLEVDDRMGLLWIDFEGGRVLQASGHAKVEWTAEKRVMHVRLVDVVESSTGAPPV